MLAEMGGFLVNGYTGSLVPSRDPQSLAGMRYYEFARYGRNRGLNGKTGTAACTATLLS